MKFAQRVLSPAKPDDESHLEGHFQTLLNSPGFHKAQSLRSLLSYLWEHRGEPISEYGLATGALGKKPDFEPNIDASVRVKISRLRQKLKEYYDSEGASSPVQIFIPLGGHELQVEWKPAPAIVSPPGSLKGFVIFFAATCLLLTIFLGFACSENRKLRSSSRVTGTARTLPPFWQHFFGNGKPASLFLPTPVFFEWTGTNLKVRDTTVNDFTDFAKSRQLKLLGQKFGPPKLLQNYTVASDCFGALKLAQYLEAKGITVSVAGTADLSIDSAGDENIILIGVAGTSRQLDELMTRTNFHSIVGSTSIVWNRKPLPGEPAEYRPIMASNIRRTNPGIVSILPGKLPGTRLLLITGNSTYPLIYSLVTPASLQAVENAWQKAGSPDFFEMVLNAEVEGRGNTVLRMWPEAVHAVDASAWK